MLAANASGPGLDPGALPVVPTCATFAADEPPHAEASSDSPTTAANHFPESFEKRLLASLADSVLRQTFAAAMKLGEFGF
jgi:hypothetical protein